tara:strand:- start:490 stop:1494 length:1005 start_codon:yes stop_codon:yes gene_type:complete
MSSFYTKFCNVESDFYQIESQIDNFQPKRELYNGAFVVDSGSRYILKGSGYVENLYVDGEDLGTNKQTQISDVDSDLKWFYQSSTDSLYLYLSADNPTARLIQAGEDWDDYKTRIANEKADLIYSFLNRPLYKRTGTGEQGTIARDWDYILIHSNAALAVAEIIRPFDPERADSIESRIIDRENGNGLLDRLKSGEYKLWSEISQSEREARVMEVAVNASSTGTIIDTRGRAAGVRWDSVKCIITQGGTITRGSENSGGSAVTYSVYIKGEYGLGTEIAVENEEINLDYQTLAYGIQIRFSPGTYTTNDQYAIELSSDAVDRPAGLRVAQMIRS